MAKDLITLQEYKTYQSIGGSSQDGEISLLIPKVSSLVKSICRRTFVDWLDEQKVEVYNGGTTEILLQEAPVISISGIEYSTDYGQSYTTLEEYVDWVFDTEKQQILSLKNNNQFLYRVNGYKITYTAGYETIPDDLKLAVLDLVTYYMKNQGAVHSVATVTTGNAQVQYLTQTNLPTHIKRVLDLYVLNYN